MESCFTTGRRSSEILRPPPPRVTGRFFFAKNELIEKASDLVVSVPGETEMRKLKGRMTGASSRGDGHGGDKAEDRQWPQTFTAVSLSWRRQHYASEEAPGSETACTVCQGLSVQFSQLMDRPVCLGLRRHITREESAAFPQANPQSANDDLVLREDILRGAVPPPADPTDPGSVASFGFLFFGECCEAEERDEAERRRMDQSGDGSDNESDGTSVETDANYLIAKGMRKDLLADSSGDDSGHDDNNDQNDQNDDQGRHQRGGRLDSAKAQFPNGKGLRIAWTCIDYVAELPPDTAQSATGKARHLLQQQQQQQQGDDLRPTGQPGAGDEPLTGLEAVRAAAADGLRDARTFWSRAPGPPGPEHVVTAAGKLGNSVATTVAMAGGALWDLVTGGGGGGGPFR